MKRILLALLTAVILFPLLFTSCTDINSDEITSNPNSIEGVWKNKDNDNYFVSFNGKGFYSAFLADEFIDSGEYTIAGKNIYCNNSYFGRETIYTIKSISDAELIVDLRYVDVYGKVQNLSMEFIKIDMKPASQRNPLAGKSCSWNNSAFGKVTMFFSTYCSGIKSATKGSAAQYPYNIFYVYIGDKMYYQLLRDSSTQIPTIGGWTSDFSVECMKVNLNPDSSIRLVNIDL